MSHIVSARINNSIYDSLEEIAANRKRKMSEILLEAINYYVTHYADYQLALERLHDHTDEIIDEETLKKRLGWHNVHD